MILITHAHGDHLDLPGLAELAETVSIGEIVAPEPHLDLIARELPHIARVGVRPYTELERLGGIAILPAWHGVTVHDGYGPMLDAKGVSPHVGYRFAIGGVNVYVSGDTLATPELVEALQRYPVRLAFLPVNGRDASREARGILGNMNATEAVVFAIAIGAEALVPLHYDGVTGNTANIGDIASAAQGQPLHLILPDRAIPFTFDGSRS